MEYKGKMMEKEGQIPKNTLKNLPAHSARQFITLKKSPARFARRGKKMISERGGGEKMIFLEYIYPWKSINL